MQAFPHATFPRKGEGERLPSSLHPRPNLVEDFLIFRKSAGLQFGEDECAVDADLKTTAISWQQFNRSELLTHHVHNRLRQAHGLWHIVSSDAVFDGNLHSLIGCHGSLPCLVPHMS